MRVRGRSIGSATLGIAMLAVLASVAPTGAGELAADGPSGAARTVRVAVCQTFCIDGDREGNLRRVEHALETATGQRAEIACFPETALLGWINPAAHELADPVPGTTTERLGLLARRHGVMICIGLCEKDGERLYDSVVLIGADGSLLARHRKTNVLTELMDPPYAAGVAKDISVVETPLGRIGMLICADTFKDDLVDRVRAQSPDLRLVPYGWAASPEAWPDHGRNLAARVAATARRAGCPVVGTDLVGVISSGPWRGKTYGGQSVVADENGTVLGVLRDRGAEVRTFAIVLR
jgi:N-carbamoylputrescine amidase